MKKLMSTRYSAGAFNFAMLLLRFSVGILMMHHGYDKLVHFGEKQSKFMNFLGLGQTVSLCLVIFAEFFCSLFLILGLFTRLSVIPLIVTMAVVLFQVHKGDIFGDDGQAAALFLSAYLSILIVGPGKISVDGMAGK